MHLRFSDIRVYIAASFFNPEQLATVMAIELELENNGVRYFSPRMHGKTIKDLPEDQRAEAAVEAFDLNLKGIWDSNVLLHVLDGKDIGSAWECGFWTGTYGKKNTMRPVIMYQTADKPLNIMLQQIASGLVKSPMALRQFLIRIQDAGLEEALSECSNFGSNLT